MFDLYNEDFELVTRMIQYGITPNLDFDNQGVATEAEAE